MVKFILAISALIVSYQAAPLLNRPQLDDTAIYEDTEFIQELGQESLAEPLLKMPKFESLFSKSATSLTMPKLGELMLSDYDLAEVSNELDKSKMQQSHYETKKVNSIQAPALEEAIMDNDYASIGETNAKMAFKLAKSDVDMLLKASVMHEKLAGVTLDNDYENVEVSHFNEGGARLARSVGSQGVNIQVPQLDMNILSDDYDEADQTEVDSFKLGKTMHHTDFNKPSISQEKLELNIFNDDYNERVSNFVNEADKAKTSQQLEFNQQNSISRPELSRAILESDYSQEEVSQFDGEEVMSKIKKTSMRGIEKASLTEPKLKLNILENNYEDELFSNV